MLDETPVTYTDIVGQTPTYTSDGHVTISTLAPGQSGTVVYHGTLEPGLTDGSAQTATASITTADVVDDQTPLDNSVNVGVNTDYPPSVVSITRTTATPTNATSVAWNVTFDQTGVRRGHGRLRDRWFDRRELGHGLQLFRRHLHRHCRHGHDRRHDRAAWCRPTRRSPTTADKPLATGNLPFGGPEYDVDTTSPTVEVVSDLDDPTNDNPLAFGLEFSEPVTGLTPGELTVVNGEVE